MDLSGVIRRAVNRHPKKTAFNFREADQIYSYSELEEAMIRFENGLREKGLGPREDVAIVAPNSRDSIIAVLSAWRYGRRVTQINPRTDPGKLDYFVSDSESEALLYDGSLEREVQVQDLDVNTIDIAKIDGDSSEIPDPDVAEDEVALLGYTSGTTGLPKGVPSSHNSIFHSANILLIRDEVRPGEKLCLLYPIYHSPALLEIIAAMMNGGQVVLPESRSADTVLNTVSEEGINVIGGVPTQLKRLAEHPEVREYDTSSLRYVHTGSGLMTPEIYSDIKQNLCDYICTSYGSSEAGETCYHLGDSTAIGRPTIYHDVRIVEPGSYDPEKDIGDEGIGELIVNAEDPQVFDGYWKKPEKTEEALRDGWYFTGDIVKRDGEGIIWFQGRVDDMIVSGGENISPGEVENALQAHPEVNHVGVIGVEDQEWGNRVVAFVEPELDSEDLDEFLRSSDLENYKRPKEYRFLDEMPLNETGGVMRKNLRDRYTRLTDRK